MISLLTSRASFAIALAMGLATLWATAAPATVDQADVFGARPIHTSGGGGQDVRGCGCDGTSAGGNCGQIAGCDGTVTYCDTVETGGAGHCGGMANDPCTHAGYPDLECAEDASCT